MRDDRMKWVGPVVTLICFAVMHTGGLIWFLSGLHTTVEHLSDQVTELKAAISNGTNDRYRASDAARDFSRIEKSLDNIVHRVETLEARKP